MQTVTEKLPFPIQYHDVGFQYALLKWMQFTNFKIHIVRFHTITTSSIVRNHTIVKWRLYELLTEKVTVHTHGIHSNESGLFKVALRQEAGFRSRYCTGLWPCSAVHGPGV